MSLTKRFADLKTISGYSADEVISALQKEIRRGNIENACFFGLELLESGDVFIDKFWERVSVIVVEDISDNQAICQVNALKNVFYELKSSKVWDRHMQAIKAIKILCEAKKDRFVSEIYDYLSLKRKDGMMLVIPEYALDMHTKKGKENKRDYLHFLEISAKVNNENAERNKKYYEELLKYYKKN
ncbi:hypothetical protein KO361_04635 [Candidatus Woesearchaeota archaeon]|nr:hypothetical protein [Candidatus Woesearchaeota archaeon]